jgi:septal ring factor EnvC (AmiA/AmiB activator)
VMAWPLPSLAQRSPSAEIGEKEKTLQQTRTQLREERARAAAARRKEASLLAELEAIDRRLARSRRQVADLNARIRKMQAEIGQLQADIKRLEHRRTGQEVALERRLRALYMIDTQDEALPLILSAHNPLDRAVKLRHLAALARVDANTIQEYRTTSDGLADRKRLVEAREQELATLRREAERERAEADREAARRRALLADVQGQRAAHDRLVGELSEATRRLEVLLRELQARQRRVAVKPQPTRPRTGPGEEPSGHGFAATRGRLMWPAEGRVVGEFGTQVHPRFGTKTFRNGVDIEVPEGTDITAVYPGHVVFTGWFRGYGNMIIVDHGGEYYTLYAHAADVLVGEGDEIKQGQRIGTVGDTGSLQGPRLYFEVRHQGKPQDPSLWLRPRG